jgi:hypothetical protein
MLIPQPKITPLEHNGIRYQQDRETDFEGREYGATYLSATDIKTAKLVWAVKICDCIKHAAGGPSDTTYVDISKIDLGPGENELTLETMVKTRHLIDLKARTSTLTYSPDWFIKPRVEAPLDASQPPMPPPWPRQKKR